MIRLLLHTRSPMEILLFYVIVHSRKGRGRGREKLPFCKKLTHSVYSNLFTHFTQITQFIHSVYSNYSNYSLKLLKLLTQFTQIT